MRAAKPPRVTRRGPTTGITDYDTDDDNQLEVSDVLGEDDDAEAAATSDDENEQDFFYERNGQSKRK